MKKTDPALFLEFSSSALTAQDSVSMPDLLSRAVETQTKSAVRHYCRLEPASTC